MRTERGYSPLSVPAMAMGVAAAALVTGIIAGGWMWGMGAGMLSGFGLSRMPYGHGYMGYGMGVAFGVGLFITGGIFGALAAWFYNLSLGSVWTKGHSGSSTDSSGRLTPK